MSCRSVVAVITVLGLFIPPNAAALPFPFYVAYEARVGISQCPPVGFCDGVFDDQSFAKMQTGVTYQFPSTTVGSASGSLSLNARLGDLSGRAEGAEGVLGDTNLIGQAAWGDTFTVVSSVLPVGTPVALRATMRLRSHVLLDPGSADTTPALFSGAIANWIMEGSPGLVLGELSNLVRDDLGPGAVSDRDDVIARDLDFIRVGDTFAITGFLQIETLSGSRDHSHRIVEAPGSADFLLDMLTADASYVTASGVTYFTDQVPSEAPGPHSLALLGLGLASLGLSRLLRARVRGRFMAIHVATGVVAVLLVLASLSPAEGQSDLKVDDVKSIAGLWAGYAKLASGGQTAASVTIRPDSSYTLNAGGRTVIGSIALSDGKATFQSPRARGTITMFEKGGKRWLKFVSDAGEVGEYEEQK